MKACIAGGGFFTLDNLMRHQPVGSIAVGCSSHVIEDEMIPFAVYAAA